MEVSDIENLPRPPGIINSIKAGFDAIAAHITSILLPLALNLFLWLGPRLRMETLFNSLESNLMSVWQQSGQMSAENIQQTLEAYKQMSQSVNLFSVVRTLPIGISRLFMPTQADFATPLGLPANLQVTGLSLPLWLIALTFIGWVGGALYFRNVAWAVYAGKIAALPVFRAIVQSVLLSILFNMVLTAIAIPVMLIIFVASRISLVLGNLVVLFMAFGSVWVIVPLFFWAHGVFLNRQNVFTSMLSSIQLTRFTLPTSSLFVLTVFLLAYGLNVLWRMPAQDSWLTLFGIFGHAFVTTALLAASFIYYHDMTLWVQAALEKLRLNKIVKQA
ncbi:MAG: hypothetical protein HXY38_12295 [Chloroflexi bacterium]|nr:hypothetical protein [Chloroflexota bacterium]